MSDTLVFRTDTDSVRPGEELDTASLGGYLRDPALEVDQFPKGHSNLVYLIRPGGKEVVLRRPPLGPVAPKAHDMAREYRVLEAVHPHFPEAPRVFHLCEDTAIIGAIFFLMERRHGLVLRDTIPPEISKIRDYPTRISGAFIECLVRLHAIDVAQTGLFALGRPDGFLERQVEGWAERWRRAKTDEIPAMEDVISWLRERLPASSMPT